ncbi:hypothetical protein J2T15_003913 [Paenibacillus harenae]|uniref:SGNH hydrolase-type esterase domain-containing protein n=1 Tax=Paenibacillus harenae TaxID=306543 RepID=A0ABT9U608_PAEHA|nr:hypothetical protein [Paenibacillus harenae]
MATGAATRIRITFWETATLLSLPASSASNWPATGRISSTGESEATVLCEPFILKVGETEEKWEEWRERIDDCRRIVRQLAEEYNAVFVPLQEAFDKASSGMDAAYWLLDGVHPTAVGHELIAREWLSIVQNSPLAIR